MSMTVSPRSLASAQSIHSKRISDTNDGMEAKHAHSTALQCLPGRSQNLKGHIFIHTLWGNSLPRLWVLLLPGLNSTVYLFCLYSFWTLTVFLVYDFCSFSLIRCFLIAWTQPVYQPDFPPAELDLPAWEFNVLWTISRLVFLSEICVPVAIYCYRSRFAFCDFGFVM